MLYNIDRSLLHKYVWNDHLTHIYFTYSHLSHWNTSMNTLTQSKPLISSPISHVLIISVSVVVWDKSTCVNSKSTFKFSSYVFRSTPFSRHPAFQFISESAYVLIDCIIFWFVRLLSFGCLSFDWWILWKGLIWSRLFRSSIVVYSFSVVFHGFFRKSPLKSPASESGKFLWSISSLYNFV